MQAFYMFLYKYFINIFRVVRIQFIYIVYIERISCVCNLRCICIADKRLVDVCVYSSVCCLCVYIYLYVCIMITLHYCCIRTYTVSFYLCVYAHTVVVCVHIRLVCVRFFASHCIHIPTNTLHTCYLPLLVRKPEVHLLPHFVQSARPLLGFSTIGSAGFTVRPSINLYARLG